MDNLKAGLIMKFGDKLFKGEEKVGTSKADKLKKLTPHLNKIINRNSSLFAKCPKTYTCKDGDNITTDVLSLGPIQSIDEIPPEIESNQKS